MEIMLRETYMREFQEILEEAKEIEAKGENLLEVMTWPNLEMLADGLVKKHKDKIVEYINNSESGIYDHLGEWLTYQFLKNPSFEVEVVDSGYDISTHAKLSDDQNSVSSYEIVQDFLDEPNGNTTPTFESGSGLIAETYSSDLDFELRDVFRDYLVKLVPEMRIGGNDFYAEALIDSLVDQDCDELQILINFSKMAIKPIIEKWRFRVNGILLQEEKDREIEKANRIAYQKWLKSHAEPCIKAFKEVYKFRALENSDSDTFLANKINKCDVHKFIKDLERLPFDHSVISAAFHVIKPITSNTASVILAKKFPLPKTPDEIYTSDLKPRTLH